MRITVNGVHEIRKVENHGF